MSGINLPNVDSGIKLEDLANLVARFIKEIQWFSDGNISANNIKANSIVTKLLAADSVKAGNIDVDQLSAITADMGTLTAGIIYGAYIATANGTYPRIEFNSLGNLLTAFLDATHKLDIIPNLGGVPALKFTAPGQDGYLALGAALSLLSNSEIDISNTSGDIFLDTTGSVEIFAPNGFWVNGVLIAP